MIKERVRITNALHALAIENREEINLARAAAMEIHAETLLSAVCQIYNELHDASRNAGIIKIRIPSKGRIRPTRENGEVIR